MGADVAERAAAPGARRIDAPLGLLVAGRLGRAAQPVLRIFDLRQPQFAELAGARATQDGVIVIFAQRFASQPRNREDARVRLAALIVQAQHREKPRRPTKPTKASKTRRLDEKSRRGVIKALRGKAGTD